MQTQPVYNYLTWVKQSFGNSAYNSLASNSAFTRTLKLNDWQLYGSSRLGIYNADTTLTNITFTINGIDSNGNFEVNQVISQTGVSVDHYNMQHFLAYKQFELTNHLGKVLATVLDRKTNNTADVVTAQHYYPFGSVMSSYKAEEFGYRFGFNGSAKENEIFRDNIAHDFGNRILDTRIGRWLSVDKLWTKFPVLSTFAFGDNNPIIMIDNGGDSTIYVNERNEILGVSHDNDENAIVIISDKNILSFKIQFWTAKLAFNEDSDKLNDRLRKLGTVYSISSIEKWYLEVKYIKDFETWDNNKWIVVNDKKHRFLGEAAINIVIGKGGVRRIGNKKNQTVGDPTGTTLPKRTNENGKVDGFLHDHPNPRGVHKVIDNNGKVVDYFATNTTSTYDDDASTDYPGNSVLINDLSIIIYKKRENTDDLNVVFDRIKRFKK